jgi:hypothetical protein
VFLSPSARINVAIVSKTRYLVSPQVSRHSAYGDTTIGSAAHVLAARCGKGRHFLENASFVLGQQVPEQVLVFDEFV